ncbi:ABC transporter permease [Streptomyces sp. NPDC059209]|uniref:ABC transporter permease n=1 Tax=Streptomyces sp. NPDC059209 TaxID=3346769 RepID=UPI0036C3F7D5
MSSVAYDSTAVLGRHLQRIRHSPGVVILTQTMPITMLLFFGYVFGSALATPGQEYRAYLVPGVLAATAAGGIMTGMFQSAQDAQRGVMDRFRTMPMSRVAVPLGQTAADVLTTAIGIVPLALVGVAVGWRVENGVPGALGAFGLLLLFRLATTWVGAYLGLLIRNEEIAGQLGSVTFVLPLLSNAYIPTEGLPGWLRVVSEWNPISAVAAAVRELCGNAPANADAAWPLANPVAGALLWGLAILAVFVPLTVRRYTSSGA